MSAAPTKTERAILSLLMSHKRLTGPQIAAALNIAPASVKVMVLNLRRLGYNITSGGPGKHGLGYSLSGVSGRSIAPTERDAIVADLKTWPLIPYGKIAKKYGRSVYTVRRLAQAWNLGRHAR